jgi:hypothetical protein
VFFDLGSGSNNRGTAGLWATQNVLGATGSVNLIATAGATFYITGVQLEPGTVATPFERRSYGQELALCERYYQGYVIASTAHSYADVNGRGGPQLTFLFRTAMRSGASVNITFGGGVNVTVGAANTTANGFTVTSTAPAVGYCKFDYTINYASAEL